jgi:hypothetical protein
VLFEIGGQKIEMINLDDLTAYAMTVPFELQNLNLVSRDKWLLEDATNKYVPLIFIDLCVNLML